MIYGLDLLAAAKYPRIAVRNTPKNWAFGVFGNVDGFGLGLPVVKKILNAGCKFIRVQMLWDDNHKFGDQHIPKLKQMAPKYEALAMAYPNAIIELSPFCEHNLSNPDKYCDIVAALAPHCTIVNTPYNGAFSHKYKNEIHGNKNAPPKGKYNYSYDGLDSVDDDVTKMKAKHNNPRCEAFFFWDHNFNRSLERGHRIPREDRVVKPSKKLIESIVFLASERGPVNLPKKWLWKSHAEIKSWPPDARANKPVALIPIKGNQLEIYAGTQRIAIMRSSGQFHDGRYVYRANKWGYEIAQLAIGVNGSPTCELRINDKFHGQVNPNFREG